MTDPCPTCHAVYPDIETYGWAGGRELVMTYYHCKKCGTRFKTVFNLKTEEMKVEVVK